MDIFEQIRELHWDQPRDVQQRAIEKLSRLNGEEVIFLAKHSEVLQKPTWENAARVLKQIGYPKNAPALPYLMEWFQDINWPGVDDVIILMGKIELSILKPVIEEAGLRCLQAGDQDWALGILQLIHRIKSEKILDKAFMHKLEKLADYCYRIESK